MFDSDELVARCREALSDPEPVLAVRDVVARAVSESQRLPEALLASRGGPVTWVQSPELTVQAIVWPQGLVTPPHEHRMWAVVGVLSGREDHELWRTTPGGLERAGGRGVEAGDVILLGADCVHAVCNPCSYPTVGVHVYGGDLENTPRREWDFDGYNEHLFDLAAVRRFIAAMGERAKALGRELSPDEVRRACFELYGKVPVR
jgi:predicted metal-dependent enzyme (double-stranded beta helix superfamily)